MRPDLREDVLISCLALIRDFSSIATEHFHSPNPPTYQAKGLVFERRSPTSHAGREYTSTVIDYYQVYTVVSTTVALREPWAQAAKSITRLVDTLPKKPAQNFPMGVEQEYLTPLLIGYVRDEGSLNFAARSARRMCRLMLAYLESETIEVIGKIALEYFSAPRAFALEAGITVRPVREDECIELGRAPPWPTMVFGPLLHPRNDWWICEAILTSPRGTPAGMNRVSDVADHIGLAMRAFKSGSVNFGLAMAEVKGAFGRQGTMGGSALKPISHADLGYSLSPHEIPKFIAFWKQFSKLMSEKHHYLLLPLRRLRSAGIRTQPEDAIVDHVVGLECLLGTEQERTELGYRFRMRGAVVLSSRRVDRKNYLKQLGDLYVLRSKIVHGQVVTSEKLMQAMPFAEEALRRVWLWYFTKWRGEKNNKRAIAWIDADLVGP